MLNLDQMREIANTENVIFYKHNCPFCIASEKLFNALVEKKIISEFNIYYLHEDFTDEQLTQLVSEFGWKSSSEYQLNCTKPQIFLAGKLIGGNFEFHKSEWNVGTDKSGQIMVSGEKKDTPNLTNPMRF